MKIKHFQGYGCVEATKISDKSCTLHICVKGEHERGLERDDLYDLYHWLIQRFDKKLKDVPEIEWEVRTKRMNEYGFEEYCRPRYEINEVSWKECHYKFWY